MTELTINEIITEAHATAKAKGWWDEPRSGLEIMALIHSEVSEAVEDLRNENTEPKFKCVRRHGDCYCFDTNGCRYGKPSPKPVGLPYELADIIIRIADYCGHEGIDLEAAIKAKMAYNRTRSYRHGGKAA